MEKYIDSLGEASWFTTLNWNCEYPQVLVAHFDRDKTNFFCQSGLHHFSRMPFGLNNAQATLEPTLDMILSRF